MNSDNTWGIMNDGLDSSGNETNNINEGNIRYFGSNPENYIYFNCSDYNNQNDSTCEKWRIVDGKVKIMKNGTIGIYQWDYRDQGDNVVASGYDWKIASLMMLLNEGEYHRSLETKNNKTLDFISESTWYVNGINSTSIYTNELYSAERTGGDILQGELAVIYPSDYGYAIDLNKCKQTFINFETDPCPSNNWMNDILTNSDSNYGWLLNPNSAVSGRHGGYAFAVANSNGYVITRGSAETVPTAYLDPTLTIDTSTKGTEGNPYKLIVE